MREEHRNLSLQEEEDAGTGQVLYFQQSIQATGIYQWVNVWMKWMKAYKKWSWKHFGEAHQLFLKPCSVDCSGKVWQANQWFSVTEAL